MMERALVVRAEDGEYNTFFTIKSAIEWFIMVAFMAASPSCIYHEIVTSKEYNFFMDIEHPLVVGETDRYNSFKYNLLEIRDFLYIQGATCVMIYTNHRPNKFSAHIYTQGLLVNNQRARALVKKIIKSYGLAHLVDAGVYVKNHGMRLPYTSKVYRGMLTPMVFNKTLSDFELTHKRDDYDVINGFRINPYFEIDVVVENIARPMITEVPDFILQEVNSIEGDFKYRSTVGNMYVFNSTGAWFCPIHNREHEGDNMAIIWERETLERPRVFCFRDNKGDGQT
tara:strand:+ start:20942 stop:21790 length:849 start_codon:yes stop_codon:yes gene_type:complete